MRVIRPQLSFIPPPLPLEKVPVKPHRLDAARIIRFRAVHQVADRINLQRLLQRMPQRHLVRFTAPVVVLEPPAIMIFRDDYRHLVTIISAIKLTGNNGMHNFSNMSTPLDRQSRDWTKGNCYYVSLQFIQDSERLIGKCGLLPENSKVLLVHGEIEPQVHPINHAWIEINDSTVLDHANNSKILVAKDAYYTKFKAKSVRKFSRQEADAIISHLKTPQGELFIGFWGALEDDKIEECRNVYDPRNSVFSVETDFTNPSDESNQSNLVISPKDPATSVAPPPAT